MEYGAKMKNIYSIISVMVLLLVISISLSNALTTPFQEKMCYNSYPTAVNQFCQSSYLSGGKINNIMVNNSVIAQDFVQLSSIYTGTNALALIKNSSTYLDANGKLNDTKHPAFVSITDTSRGKAVLIKGISVTKQTAILEQALFELKTLNNNLTIQVSTLTSQNNDMQRQLNSIKECTKSSKDFFDYQKCVGGLI